MDAAWYTLCMDGMTGPIFDRMTIFVVKEKGPNNILKARNKIHQAVKPYKGHPGQTQLGQQNQATSKTPLQICTQKDHNH